MSRPFSFTSVISKTGTLCLPLFQLVLSDPLCEENETCINYKDQYPNGWYIWLLLLIFLMALLCGAVLFCLQCWLRRPRMGSQRHTMAVFAVGDLDPVCGCLHSMADERSRPTPGIQTQQPWPPKQSMQNFEPQASTFK
uniref:Transmembrane protein 207 n=1 Tax=Equus caballus TaxID=9796 RepID=A0A9L0SDK1_HORSE